MTAQLFPITEFSQRVPCPATWARDRDAILAPLRDASGRRLYTEAHVERARQLRTRARKATA
jgi:hypothetical protein